MNYLKESDMASTTMINEDINVFIEYVTTDCFFFLMMISSGVNDIICNDVVVELFNQNQKTKMIKVVKKDDDEIVELV